jgi:V8-like Glu-specific endopeptidase
MSRSMARSSSVILVLLAALGAGCTPPVTVGETRAPIIGGSVDNADPGVVLLFAQVPGSQSGSLCSAEIVSPHVVLTAAHCVAPSEVGQGAQFVVYPGVNFDQAQQADLLAVSETHFDAQFSTQNVQAGHDIGVAILAKPTAITPLPVNRTPLDTTFVGKPVRFVGYGLDDSAAQTGAGTKRQTTTTLSDYTALLVHFTDGLHETCNGDSGGPAFMTVNGKEVIVGLTSFGDVNCNQGGYDTRVDALLSFVDGYVQMFDPTLAAPPDMGHAAAPDMGQAPSPSTQPGSPTQPSQPSSPSQPSEPSAPSSPSGSSSPSGPSQNSEPATGRAAGESCGKDADCASHICGLSKQGTLVCVAGAPNEGSFGCDAGQTGDDRMILAFLVTMAFLLSRGLVRRRR